MIFEKSLTVMEELFAKDCQLALATSKDNIPSVRFVDTYYQDGAFYIVTYKNSQKVRELQENKEVALCRDMYRFCGTAYEIGHPLIPENKELREKLIKVFEPWYFQHNNESDEEMCYVKVVLSSGFFYQKGIGYRVDFKAAAAEEFPFEFDIIPA